MQKGRKISNPSQYYTVQRGDTLWDVARKSGVPLDTIIASNIELIRERMIRAGDKLVIR
jgi:membrane-bound lytic murein transglycosylase D